MDNRKSKDFLSHLISFHFRRAGIWHCLSEAPRPNWSIMVIISVSASSKTKLHALKWLKYNEKLTLSNASVKMIPYSGSNEVKINFSSVRDLAAKRCPLLMPLGKHHVILPKEVAQVRMGSYMKQATSQPDTVFEKATGKFLPIIDLNPANETRIYSTLLFVIDEAKRIGIPTPCIIFYQLLWRKA